MAFSNRTVLKEVTAGTTYEVLPQEVDSGHIFVRGEGTTTILLPNPRLFTGGQSFVISRESRKSIVVIEASRGWFIDPVLGQRVKRIDLGLVRSKEICVVGDEWQILRDGPSLYPSAPRIDLTAYSTQGTWSAFPPGTHTLRLWSNQHTGTGVTHYPSALLDYQGVVHSNTTDSNTFYMTTAMEGPFRYGLNIHAYCPSNTPATALVWLQRGTTTAKTLSRYLVAESGNPFVHHQSESDYYNSKLLMTSTVFGGAPDATSVAYQFVFEVLSGTWYLRPSTDTSNGASGLIWDNKIWFEYLEQPERRHIYHTSGTSTQF